MILKGLSQESSEIIDLVVASYYSAAITSEEVGKWALYMVEKYNAELLPTYIFDLVFFNETLRGKLMAIIGFAAGEIGSYQDDLALSGIAVARGVKLFEEPAPPAVLLKKLQERPWLFKKYKETFPFIDVSAIEKKLFASSNIK